MKPKVIAALALVALLVLVVAQNASVVTYRFLFWTMSMSQVILFPFAALLGFLLGYIVGSMGRRRAAPPPKAKAPTPAP